MRTGPPSEFRYTAWFRWNRLYCCCLSPAAVSYHRHQHRFRCQAGGDRSNQWYPLFPDVWLNLYQSNLTVC